MLLLLRTVLALAVLPALAGAQTFTELTSPCPLSGPCPGGGGQFGMRVVELDFDGDGARDVAVGEPGRDAVHVFLGPDFANPTVITLAPTGFVGGCPVGTGRNFGSSLAAGELDGRPGDELVIGAPSALGGRGELYLFSDAGLLRRFASWRPGVRAFGGGLAVADFDQDGRNDVAVGAGQTAVGGTPAVGTLHVFSSLLGGERILVNPAYSQGLAEQGQYAQKLRVGDVDGDGWPDLVASALGNSQSGAQHTGAAYVHPTPVVAPPGVGVPAPQRLDDPNVVPCDYGPRYAREFDVRDGMVAIAAQRKEPLGWTCPGGVQEDSGGAFLFSGSGLGVVEQAPDVSPSHEGLFGFAVSLVDLVGSPAPDLAVASLQDRDVHVWESADLAAPPLVVPLPPGAVYWAFGIARGNLNPATPHETLILGDPRADGCAGRVLLLEM